MISLNACAAPERACREAARRGSPNIPCAQTTPAIPPSTWTSDVRRSRPTTQAALRCVSQSSTAGLKCAPDTGPNVRIRHTSAAPVATLFASRATATFPPDSSLPMIPEPTTAAARRAVPMNSAARARAIEDLPPTICSHAVHEKRTSALRPGAPVGEHGAGHRNQNHRSLPSRKRIPADKTSAVTAALPRTDRCARRASTPSSGTSPKQAPRQASRRDETSRVRGRGCNSSRRTPSACPRAPPGAGRKDGVRRWAVAARGLRPGRRRTTPPGHQMQNAQAYRVGERTEHVIHFRAGRGGHSRRRIRAGEETGSQSVFAARYRDFAAAWPCQPGQSRLRFSRHGR